MKALVYARYSTHKQDNGVSIENQIARCREYATYRGLDIVDIIQDLAVSGGVNKGRAGFMELLHRAEQGECDLILTYDLTRLSREMLSLLALERLLNEWEVETPHRGRTGGYGDARGLYVLCYACLYGGDGTQDSQAPNPQGNATSEGQRSGLQPYALRLEA